MPGSTVSFALDAICMFYSGPDVGLQANQLTAKFTENSLLAENPA